MSRILFAAGVAVAFTAVQPAQAQYRATDENGIAASPRLRQMMDERRANAVVVEPPVVVTPSPAPEVAGNVAASPRLRQMQTERNASGVAPATGPVIVSPAQGADNIAASPKLREQLNERPTPFQIAPLK
ncbi:MAG TPA: hypothetical protein VNT26_21290 [Candidatus Sulfotelmatobacter sp.]|nr:hypothetical protein [Candidatus Sulfotelmatobacter sp.]